MNQKKIIRVYGWKFIFLSCFQYLIRLQSRPGLLKHHGLTKTLVRQSFSSPKQSRLLIFFAEKICGDFALQKMAEFLQTICLNIKCLN